MPVSGLPLSGSRPELVFPCDAQGRVQRDALADRARNNYLYARAVVGRECARRQSGRVDLDARGLSFPGEAGARSPVLSDELVHQVWVSSCVMRARVMQLLSARASRHPLGSSR
jgi:hypothetical protein